MAESDSSSVYTSTFTATDSAVSETDFVEPYDIALIYNTKSNLNRPVAQAKDLLQNKGYNVRDSVDHSFNAGKLKPTQHFNETFPAKYRIVIFNKAYKKHDIPLHASMLYNRKFTTRENTLIILRKKHLDLLPKEMHDLQRRELENDVTGAEIDEVVTKFVMGTDGNPDPSLERYEDQYKQFQCITENFNAKRSFLLITNISHPVPPCMRYLARVTWLKVFDFDYESQENGLLSVVKPHLTHGKFLISSTHETPKTPSDASTDWTKWVNAEGETNAENILDAHINMISQHCSGQKVATLVILWYTNSKDFDFDLHDLVRDIERAFRSNRGINCILFTQQTPDANTALNRITQSSNRDSFRFVVPLSVLSQWIKQDTEEVDDSSCESRLIPSYNHQSVALSERHYNWLSADMDVLTFSPSERTREPAVKDGIDFLQGGTITWKTIQDGVFDARRSATQKVVNFLTKEHIEKGISGVVYLHHHPGSGGTTLGRRVLWEMHKIVPCIAVHPGFEVTEDFREKVKFVRNYTNITVLLLVDGRVDAEKILTALSHERLIILNVIRYYGSMENKRDNFPHFFLKDEVTKQESDVVLPIYSRYGQQSCEELRRRTRSQKIFMYEYGLTAFTDNFFGVRKYVEGHLKFDKEREPWHYVIAFLAIALHYGQKMLPCEMFSHLLQTKKNATVKKQDIPFYGRQLVKEDDDKWSITYTEVAREILKQLLTKEGQPSPTGSRTLDLKGTACDELKELAVRFIIEMRKSLSDSDAIPRHKLLILREVFITRNETNDEVSDKNVKYSMLLRDVEKNDHRGEILKKLVECFPKHVDFHAHLGRYYGKSKFIPEAEKSFQKAIEVRMNELALYHGHQESDEVLQRVHHMFGYFYFNRIPEFLNQGDIAEQVISDILQLANKAITQFVESRKYFMLGTNPTYGLLGEVNVRIRVVKLAKDLNLPKSDAAHLASHFLRLRNFFFESFGICDHLLAQCIEQATEQEIQHSEFSDCIEKLFKVFQENFKMLEEWAKRSSTLSSKLCQIAALKQQLGIPDPRYSVFYARGEENLKRLLHLYESVIRGATDDRKRISSEMIDWLKIIRRTNTNYSLQTVLEFVESWDKRNEKNSLSMYYSYILNVVLAISFPGESMSQKYRINAERLGEKLGNSEKTLVRHVLFRSHEWLGMCTNPTLNMLVHRDLLGPKREKINLLRRCTGTIITIKGWYGWLHLDGFSDPAIKVFFTPQQYRLTSQHANEKVRAEFYLGFNPRHGAEAFNLHLIETKMCPCGNVTEIKGADDPEVVGKCWACRRPFRI